ncbi:MAG: clostripain-related cysteine peptidase [Thermoplasmata archaeon]
MYWDADNNLEFCTEFAFSTWEEALRSNDRVDIVVLVDYLSKDGIWLYDIIDGERRLVKTWDEMNTSDPQVLEKFVVWGMQNYPAEKTMLIVQDHGYGWRGVCQDETNGDVLMPIDGLAKALKDARPQVNDRGVDLLAFDACSMATIEVVYELRGAVPYLVASQSMVPYDGLPYAMFVSDLVENPMLSPRELAANIVTEYVKYYGSKKDYEHIYTYNQDFATMSAWDMSKVNELGTAFVDLTAVLDGLIVDNRKIVERARGYALQGNWANMAGYEWMPDAYALFDGLRGIDPELDGAIESFQEAFDCALILEDHSRRLGQGIHGLNIWFPPSLSQYSSQGWIWARQFIYVDIGLDLVTESTWNDCLMAYYASGP